ncbi:uncharacterized protein E0L32_002277 [Thyridium curvatum]|uniref:Uncharacterized protein n=1 Tax=Thyridium curvatum TaxID=1093900 RepID=A0A507APM1_9PEZI|nr:uncharacterized protein E0L32_002277 [Thyridium curvatum]TPX06781.1 hypothetical protein E0L32_002277 [Thyridium curvatum]
MAQLQGKKAPADAFSFGKAKDTYKTVDKEVAKLVKNFELLSEDPTIRGTSGYDKAKKTRQLVADSRQELGDLCKSLDSMWEKDPSQCVQDTMEGESLNATPVLKPAYQKKVAEAVKKTAELGGHCQQLGLNAKSIEESLDTQKKLKMWKLQHPVAFAALSTLIKAGTKGIIDVGDLV